MFYLDHIEVSIRFLLDSFSGGHSGRMKVPLGQVRPFIMQLNQRFPSDFLIFLSKLCHVLDFLSKGSSWQVGDKGKQFLRKYFMDGEKIFLTVCWFLWNPGQKLEDKQLEALATLPSDASFLQKLLVRHRRLIGELIFGLRDVLQGKSCFSFGFYPNYTFFATILGILEERDSFIDQKCTPW